MMHLFISLLILWFSPSIDHAALATVDDLLRSAFCRITNSGLTDAQCLQANLPIKDGGLGVRRVALVALTAYLAFAVGIVSLQDAILSGFACPTDPFLDTFRQTWSSAFGTSPRRRCGTQTVFLGHAERCDCSSVSGI